MSVIEQVVARFSSSPRILSRKPSVLNEVLDVTTEVGDAGGCGAEARAKVPALKKVYPLKETVAGVPHRVSVASVARFVILGCGHWGSQMIHRRMQELFARFTSPPGVSLGKKF